jgi:hypothetical protein
MVCCSALESNVLYIIYIIYIIDTHLLELYMCMHVCYKQGNPFPVWAAVNTADQGATLQKICVVSTTFANIYYCHYPHLLFVYNHFLLLRYILTFAHSAVHRCPARLLISATGIQQTQHQLLSGPV